MTRSTALVLLLLLGPAFAGPGGEAGRYIETEDYIRSAFAEELPAPSTLWVSGDLRDTVERVLGHRFNSLRVRYWFDGETSVWILDEIGKELPITDQFVDARLNPDECLDRSIDGITGAMLSVGAVTRIARVALLMHEHIAQ